LFWELESEVKKQPVRRAADSGEKIPKQSHAYEEISGKDER
jgi:hypothetical protein